MSAVVQRSEELWTDYKTQIIILKSLDVSASVFS